MNRPSGSLAVAGASRHSISLAALSAVALSIPHALGLGLLAFAPLAGQANVAALALWSAALPAALLAVVAARPGVVHAPTTVVALLFASVLATVARLPPALNLGPAQMLAVAGATAALGFALQWLLGVLRFAALARFLPIPVAHGFAAGVGLAMVVSQFRSGFGAGAWSWTPVVLQHAGVAAGVIVLALLLQRRWPAVPGLLPAAALVTLGLAASGASEALVPAMAASAFSWPPLPDFAGVPWIAVLRAEGESLVSLALLMAIVNSLDLMVFNQELELRHGVRGDPNAVLRRESLVGALCALAGWLPALTSASRSRVALAGAGPTPQTGRVHAALMLLVAATGHLWLPWLPMAGLSAGLLLAGFGQVPSILWSRSYARTARATWAQSWLVALVFAVSGGVGALLAGLVVATFVLLHSSASTALRRGLLDGQLRSRRLRRAADEERLTHRMDRLAVFELQGVMSFGVAAHLAGQVRKALLPRHELVILDSARVAAWDATALAQLEVLVADLRRRRLQVAISGLKEVASPALLGQATLWPDLDRGLEWAEEILLAADAAAGAPVSVPELGDLEQGLSGAGLAALRLQLCEARLSPWQPLFAAGHADSDLVVVRAGRITLSTAWPPEAGLRLATIGRGMAFGEMAFLNGQPRTASAGTEAQPAELVRLSRAAFEGWSRAHPSDALRFMANLAQVGTGRLAATTRQLRLALE